jgi:hypothetical protein
MKETYFREKIQNDLKERHIYYRHFAALGNAGFPDLLICHNGRCLFIETKGEHQTFSALRDAWEDRQQIEAKRLKAAGFQYWLAGTNRKNEILFIDTAGDWENLTDYRTLLFKILLCLGAA